MGAGCHRGPLTDPGGAWPCAGDLGLLSRGAAPPPRLRRAFAAKPRVPTTGGDGRGCHRGRGRALGGAGVGAGADRAPAPPAAVLGARSCTTGSILVVRGTSEETDTSPLSPAPQASPGSSTSSATISTSSSTTCSYPWEGRVDRGARRGVRGRHLIREPPGRQREEDEQEIADTAQEDVRVQGGDDDQHTPRRLE